MFTVALIGPDGAGKTTACMALLRTLPLPVKYIYMGVNTGSSNRMLPTTRLLQILRRALGKQPDAGGPRDPDAVSPEPRGAIRRGLGKVKAAAWLAHVLSEECYRFGLAWWYMKRGYIVLCDRHFFLDYYHYDINPPNPHRPLYRRIHGYALNRLFPRPCAVIVLDAPAEVLFNRKGEGTLKLLEKRRQQYRQFEQIVDHFFVVDASQSIEAVVGQATQHVSDLYCRSASQPVGLAGESQP